MKKIVIRGLAAILVAFALVACTSTPDEPEPDVVTTFEFDLSYASAAPINVFPSIGKGSAKVTLNETQKTVEVSGTYADLSAPVSAAHIHAGAKGATGDVVAPLVVTADVAPTIAVVGANTGSFSLEATTLTDDQIAAMKAGNHYINVHTAVNPSGEIRGQISNDEADAIVTYVTELSALNASPAVTTPSTGVGKSVATLNTTTGMAMLVGNYSGLTGPAVAAHIHVGAKGVAGPVAIPLTVVDNPEAPGSGVFGFPATAVTPEQVAGLQGGQFYINIHTEANPSGEIRGQIE